MNPRTRTTAASLRAALTPDTTVQLTRAQLAEHHASGEVTRANLARPTGEPPIWLGFVAGPVIVAIAALLLAVAK